MSNMITCDYCWDAFEDDLWESGKKYTGIDRHHNPPEFITKRLGELWKGEILNLCREHHVQLHREIKIILNRIAGTLKFVNSEHWILQKMNLQQVRSAKEEVYNFTKNWVKHDRDTN